MAFDIWDSVFILPAFIYSVIILWIAHHWFYKKEYHIVDQSPQTKVSVLISFKNEQQYLLQLVAALQAQTYPNSLVEYLFINDHSDDEGMLLLENYTVILSDGNGKKAALKTGLNNAKGELILTLDADCIPKKNWLATIISFYEQEKSDLIICPVIIAPTNSFWDKIQALEFQSLAASTAGAALGGNPIMCNGANLAFRKSLVETEEDFFRNEYASGDDMFLLEFAKAKKKKISYLKSKNVMVSTAPVAWNAFWKQRSRWASKAGGYKDAFVIFTGIVVFITNLFLLVLPFISWSIFLLALAAKGVVDLFLLVLSARFFNTKRYLWLYPLLVPLYPIYVFVAGVKGIFSKTW